MSPLVALVTGLVVGAALVAVVVVTRRRLAEEPVRVEPDPTPEQLLARRLVDLMDPAVVVVDLDEAVVLANPAARALGIVRGTRLLVPELLRVVREVRDGGSRRADVSLPGDLVGTGPRLVGVHGVRLESGQAPVPGPVALVLLDVTEARRVEEVRRDFVANVGHELKTPVGALALLAEAVQDAADDPETVQRFAARMSHEADRLARLVRELIDLSRLQGGEPLPELVPVDVDTVLLEATDRTGLAAAAKHIDIVVGGERGLVVRGVEGQLATAVTNLLANAVALQPGAHPHRGGRAGAVGLRGDRGDRQRDRHPARGPLPGLRALLPRRPVAGHEHRRHGPGAGHRQARRQQPRRLGDRLERGGAGLDLHPAHPARGRRPSAALRGGRRTRRRPGRRLPRASGRDPTPGHPAPGLTRPPSPMPAGPRKDGP